MSDLIQKPADTDYPIHDLLANRWSPRAFKSDPIAPETLRSLFEAVRWSASCFNGQPWRFIVARQEDSAEFEKMVNCLGTSAQRWAPNAPVIMLAIVKTTFYDDSPNRHARYDLGLGVQNLTVEATSHGLSVHQVAGIQPDVARETYQIPDEYDIMTAVIIGYQGTLDDLMEYYHERELKPRTREPQSAFVFSGEWGNSAEF